MQVNNQLSKCLYWFDIEKVGIHKTTCIYIGASLLYLSFVSPEEILKICDLIELYQDYKENSIGEGGSRISGGQNKG